MDLIIEGDSVAKWHQTLFDIPAKNDFLVFYSNEEDYIWFITQYIQFISRDLASVEIAPLFGRQINSLKSFMYQFNFSLPVGYRMKANWHALYDLALNFETEPLHRFIFWNDADYLLKKNQTVFEGIFERLVVAAFLNREGIGAIKENGSPYKVNQRNFLFFKEENRTEVNVIQSKKYYIPPCDTNERISFTTVLLKI